MQFLLVAFPTSLIAVNVRVTQPMRELEKYTGGHLGKLLLSQ